ncbi:MAG: hypothetical protein J7497_01585 [Chitinophagaceae bacterium]|nr:hypothetical protein [Chitinophagaceae bacterium]
MKLLKDYTILFDEQCPICNAYANSLVKSGMIESRAAYQQVDYSNVDMQRAVNEIALVNNKTGEVQYGIKSIFVVFGNSFPFLKPLFSFAPFVWVMSKLYLFISYNRRVIAPPHDPDAEYKIQPTLRKDYRVIYLLVTGFIAVFIFSRFMMPLHTLFAVGNKYSEYLILFSHLIIQSVIVGVFYKEKLWAYAGNMMTVYLIGSFLLLPALIVSAFTGLNYIVYLIYFIVVFILMLAMHIRRVKLIRASQVLTISWLITFILSRCLYLLV